MAKSKLMIAGLGDLAGWVLEFVARTPGLMRLADIVTADVNEDMGLRRTNSAILGAAQMGYYPSINFTKLNLFDVEETASLLRKVQPDVIYNGATLQSWWVITQLPPEEYQKIDKARYGPWLPMHLLLTYNLMQAIKEADIQTLVVNSAFPDAVNSILDKVGLAPTIGIGNIDNVIPCLRKIVSDKMGVPMQEVAIYMAAPHFVSYYIARYGSSGGAPFLLKICVREQDVTGMFNVNELLKEVPTSVKRLSGIAGHSLVASSSAKIILAMLRDSDELGNAPGPQGLPGGYPVRMNARGAEVIVPQGTTLEEMIRINNEAQKYDGIEGILDDGTAVFTDASYQVMKDVVGYDCKTLKLSECADRVKELDSLFKAYVDKHRV